MNAITRFEKYIFYSPDGCWYWTSDMNQSGYGRIFVNGIATLAHRFSYSINVDDIHVGLQVLHKCDNRLCVNPYHLFLGTNDDNMKDKVKKGRSQKGEKHPRCKVTTEAVIQIRKMFEDGIRVSHITRSNFGLSRSGIQSILEKKTWKHI